MQRYYPYKPFHFVKRYLHFFSSADKKREHFARKLIGYSSEDMYNIVADVKNYKNFVPFCMKSTILLEKPEMLMANMEVGFSPIVENYTSRVTLKRPTLVQAICTDGKLFNYLETTWKFNPGLKSNPKSCIIDFYIKFEFRSMLHSQIASMVFDTLVKQMDNAFMVEAKKRYGRESLPSHPLSTAGR